MGFAGAALESDTDSLDFRVNGSAAGATMGLFAKAETSLSTKKARRTPVTGSALSDITLCIEQASQMVTRRSFPQQKNRYRVSSPSTDNNDSNGRTSYSDRNGFEDVETIEGGTNYRSGDLRVPVDLLNVLLTLMNEK